MWGVGAERICGDRGLRGQCPRGAFGGISLHPCIVSLAKAIKAARKGCRRCFAKERPLVVSYCDTRQCRYHRSAATCASRFG